MLPAAPVSPTSSLDELSESAQSALVQHDELVRLADEFTRVAGPPPTEGLSAVLRAIGAHIAAEDGVRSEFMTSLQAHATQSECIACLKDRLTPANAVSSARKLDLFLGGSPKEFWGLLAEKQFADKELACELIYLARADNIFRRAGGKDVGALLAHATNVLESAELARDRLAYLAKLQSELDAHPVNACLAKYADRLKSVVRGLEAKANAPSPSTDDEEAETADLFDFSHLPAGIVDGTAEKQAAPAKKRVPKPSASAKLSPRKRARARLHRPVCPRFVAADERVAAAMVVADEGASQSLPGSPPAGGVWFGERQGFYGGGRVFVRGHYEPAGGIPVDAASDPRVRRALEDPALEPVLDGMVAAIKFYGA